MTKQKPSKTAPTFQNGRVKRSKYSLTHYSSRMGIDIASYRSRIGCYSQNRGTDVIVVSVDVHFSKAAKYTGFLFSITMLLAMTVYNFDFSHLQDKPQTEMFISVDRTLFTAGTLFCFASRKKGAMLMLMIVGAVMFIQLLLLSAGVEPNPGPLPGSKEENKKDNEKTGNKQSSEIDSSQAEAVSSAQTVTDVPMVNVSSRGYIVIFGKTATLECTVNDIPRARSVQWKKMVQETFTPISIDGIKYGGGTVDSPSLIINNVDRNDEGLYLCTATNLLGTTQSKPIGLNVSGGIPRVITEQNSYSAIFGQSVKLQCSVISVPTCESVTWKRTTCGNTSIVKVDDSSYLGSTVESPSLTIEKAVTSDEGTYICYASNKLGTGSSVEVAVKVSGSIPRVTIEQNSYSVIFGQSVKLLCSVIAVPACNSVTWQRTMKGVTTVVSVDAPTYTGSSVKCPLTINKVNSSDEGTYVCVASNEVGTGSSDEVTLKVSGSIPRVTMEQNSYSVIFGQSVKLLCSVKAVPACTSVTWKRTTKGVTTVVSVDASTYTGSSVECPSLTIKKVNSSDEGTYVCVVSNEVGTGSGDEVTLKVSGNIPAVKVIKKYYSVTIGKPVTLQCSVTAVPDLKCVSWERTINGVTSKINIDGLRYKGSSKKSPSLEIISVRNTDNGSYICYASNEVGTGSSTAMALSVSGSIPRVTMEQNSYSVIFGQSVKLLCSVNAVPACTSVTWKRTTKGVTTVVSVDASTYTGSSVECPSLTINKVNSSDEGTYVCVVSNEVGTGSGDEVTLKVSGSIPRVTMEQNSYSVIFGQSVKLLCSVNAVPACTSVTWKRTTKGVTTVVSVDASTYTGSSVECPSLTINKVNSSDEGTYVCVVSNEVGTRSGDEVTLKVSGSIPRVTMEQNSYSVIFGQSVKLLCSVNAVPACTSVTWKRTTKGVTTVVSVDASTYTGSSVECPSLTINKVNSSDEGTYVCVVSNEVGTGSGDEVTLKVSGNIPAVKVIKKYYSVTIGKPVTLQCSVTAVPDLKCVSWERTINGVTSKINIDGLRYKGSSKKSPSLEIISVRNTDNGSYICYASNEVGTGSSTAMALSVSGSIPRVTMEQNSYSVIFGQSVKLLCSVNAVPACTSVTWQRTTKGVTTVVSVDASTYTGSSVECPSLTINKVNSSDEGTYVCVVSNEVGTGSGDEVTLKVSGSIPRVTMERKSYSVIFGQSVKLLCSVNAVPTCKSVTWQRTTKGVTTFVDDSAYTGSSVEYPSLTINKVSSSDEGTYVCLASNEVGTGRSLGVTLNVIGSTPIVTIVQRNYSVLIGNSVTLHCSIQSIPLCTSVIWKRSVKGTTQVVSVDGFTYKVGSAEYPSLIIASVSKADEGTYICLASNDVGTGRSVEVTLKVLGSSPTVDVTTCSYNVLAGKTATLECRIKAIPRATSIQWGKKSNNTFTHISMAGIKYGGGTVDSPTLIIKGVNRYDEGVYSCMATNLVGTNRSQDITLRVSGSIPGITIEQNSYSVSIGNSVTLYCSIKSVPTCKSVKWQHSVKGNTTDVIVDGSVYKGSSVEYPSLTIDSVSKSDEGTYICLAKNDIGTGRSVEVTLNVSGNSIANLNGVWKSILDKMGIATSSKLSFNDIMAVTWRQEKNLQTSDIPRELLSGLIMTDYKVRDNLLEFVFKSGCNSTNNDGTDNDYDTEISFDVINTQDVFITLFNSCDSFLKQIIVNKMCICRLAVPIIYYSMPNRIPTFSLWPLRSTIFEIKGDKATEVSIVRIPMKIVSFVRYERLHSMSKSKLLNDILSDESHDTFYHRDCPLGLTDRKLADGLVEASWYIPAGKETEFFENITMFYNLRGDASKCQEQLDFLNVVSNVIVIIIDTEKAYNCFSRLKETRLQTANIILLLSGKLNDDASKRQELTRLCRSEIPRVTIISTFRKNTSDLKKELRSNILFLCKTGEKSLEKCAEIATKFGFYLDEDTPYCKNSKKDAEKVFKLLKLSGDDPLVKENVLPLQGKLWKKWTEEYKELRKTGKGSISGSDKHKTILASLRSEQANLAKQLSPFLTTIITILAERSSNRDYISYFLNWIKFFLDQRSRDIIPPLTLKYHECWRKLKAAQNQKSENLKSLKSELKSAEEALVDASLGFEHIIRELGQLYEVTIDCALTDKVNWQYIKDLPNIVSLLLLFGFPIELMDGDVANVPCRWIKAVLNSLVARIGDKRVLTLSILGIQSSGKSTLLNTMFGLQFAVSAGRCTRGIYVQLLPVHHSKNKVLMFDYILLLDTEGLRAPELGLQKYNHDNELATLILGLGDITIINIKGENISEIKDVLQIAVHAILRLKSANETLDLQQSCIFIHQNVPAMNAQQKMQQGRQKLVENLDKMTGVAAEQENITNIKTFNQVIQFDSQESVWYLSDLWHGDPPMSYANPGYSEVVKKVKESILLSTIKHKTTFLTLSDTSRCIVDLWNGILADDFVFSFRNSNEMKIFSSMEIEYQKLTWELEKFMADLMRQISIAITVKDSVAFICSSFENKVYYKQIKIRTKLETYFDTHEYSEILIQWKESKIELLKCFTRNAIEKSKVDLKKMHEEKRIGNETEVKKNRCFQEITEKAKMLAREFKGKKPPDHQIRIDFEYMWSTWIDFFSPTLPEYESDLCLEITNTLFQRYPNLQMQLQNQLERIQLDYWNERETLSDSFQRYRCKEDGLVSFKHLSTKIWYILSDRISREVSIFSNELSRQVHTMFDSIEAMDTKFENVHLKSILGIVDNKFYLHESDDTKQFSFLPKFQAIVLVHTCRFTVYKFKRINERNQKRHPFKAKIDSFKDTTWSMFKNIVSKKSDEIIASQIFCDTVRSFIERTMNENISIVVKEKILVEFGHCKYRLLVKIMDDLADKQTFQLYMDYVSTPRNYALKCIMDYTKSFLFTKPNKYKKTEYEKCAEEYVENIINKIQQQFTKASQMCKEEGSNKMAIFITQVTNSCEDFKITEAEKNRLSGFSLHDVDDFLVVTKEYLNDTKNKILESIRNVTEIVWTQPIYDEITDRLWGCEAICPFCCEPCQHPKDHAGNHTALQHRPPGISGKHCRESDVLNIQTCSFNVQTTKGFHCCGRVRKQCQYPNCPKTDDVLHPYNKYKEVIPHWDIAPSSDQSNSMYWNWFMAKNIDDILKYHNKKCPEIPSHWNKISLTQAKDSLRHVYLPDKK